MRSCAPHLVALALIASASAQVPAPEDLEPGVTFRVYDIGYELERLYPLAPEQTPNLDELRASIDFGEPEDFAPFGDHFVVEVLAWLRVDEAGELLFELTSDDGSALWLDGSEVVRHDGLHAATPREGRASLEAGLHALRVMMFENAGDQALSLSWKRPQDEGFSLVPGSALFVERGTTRVVSPGRKRVLDGKHRVRPGDGLDLDAVHPSWTVEDLRPEGFEPQVGGMAFLGDGRLVVSSFEPLNNGVFRTEPNGTLWALANVLSGATEPVEVTRIADGFDDPLGVACVDGDLYVCDRNAIWRLRDGDGDGAFEQREVFASDWVSDNYHHFTFGLIEHEGFLYGTLSTAIYFENTLEHDNVRGEVVSMNGPNPEHRGTCFRVDLATRAVEYLAGGLRTPNGIAVGPRGEIFVGDNQGAWLPSSKLVHVRQGAFFGHYNGRQTSDAYPDGGFPSLFEDRPVSPPAVWLPQNECANSPAQPLLLEEGEFAGQMLLAELTKGGLRRVFLERVGGVWQGAVFRHSQGFECGLNRLVLGPDGCLYVGGIGASGNWSWRDRRFGLQRMRRCEGSAFEYRSIEATPEGFLLRFTRPVPTDWLADPGHYELTRWHYVPTAEYGGVKHDERRLAVTAAAPAEDKRSVRLTVEGLTPGSVVHVRTDPVSDDGERMWSTEAWYTLNELPPAPRSLERD